MVDSPQGPVGPPEKPKTDPLIRPKLEPAPLPPPGFFTMMEDLMKRYCERLPVFLVCCGFLASVVLFFTGFDCTITGRSSEAEHQGWYFIGLALFVGPLLFGIAGMLHQMNQRKRD